MENKKLPRHLRRLERVWMGGHTPSFFLTICVHNRQFVLANKPIHDRLVEFLATSPNRYDWWPNRYVLMPDHLHLLVVQGLESVTLGAWVAALKAVVGQRKFRWQKNFFDHVLRSDESESEKWEYIRQNPVRAGLVKNADDWLYGGEIYYDGEKPKREL